MIRLVSLHANCKPLYISKETTVHFKGSIKKISLGYNPIRRDRFVTLKIGRKTGFDQILNAQIFFSE